jgi:NAD-dependent dihydropyrimidine dehydrogenase PreA subunit
LAKDWYPIIDYEKCANCLTCTQFCLHGVYEVHDGKPVVAHPENCVEFCRGCQKGACGFGAIRYFGDTSK